MPESTTEERWRPVAGEFGYEVSDHGRVRSLDRVITCVDGRRLGCRGKILRPVANSDGYLRVTFRDENRKYTRKVHIMVLEAFVGPRPVDHVACHWDDNPANNQLGNLRWATISENQRDRVRNGGSAQANRTHCLRGHRLAAPNLIPDRKGRKTGRATRECLACNRALSLASWRRRSGQPVPEVQDLADSYYAELLSGTARPFVHRRRRAS